jgi:hypothetical protein
MAKATLHKVKEARPVELWAVFLSLASLVFSLCVGAGSLYVASVAAGILENPHVTFVVADRFSPCFDYEEVRVTIRPVASETKLADDWLSIENPSIPYDELSVTVPRPGSYTYVLSGHAILSGSHETVHGHGTDTFVVDRSTHRFLIVSAPNQQIDKESVCPVPNHEYCFRFNNLGGAAVAVARKCPN